MQDPTTKKQAQRHQESPREDGGQPRARARRRLAWRALFLGLTAPLAALMVVGVLLIGNEVTAPSWVTRKVEARASEVLAGGQLDFGAMSVTLGRDLHPRLVLRDTVLRDSAGAVLARVPRIEGLVSPRGALQGRILAQEVVLQGAQLRLRRDRDGTVAVAFDGGAAEASRAETFLGLVDQLDAMVTQGPLEALEHLRATGLIINYADARAGRNWTVDNGQVALDMRDDETVISARVALLSGRANASAAEFTYSSPKGSAAAEFGVTISDMAAPDIASQSPLLSWLGVLEAPISGALRGVVDRDGALTSASATLQIGEGRLQPTAQTRPVPFEGARTYLSYNPAESRLTFDLIEVDSDWGALKGTGHADLREFDRGWPGAIIGQVRIDALQVNPAGLYSGRRDMGPARADFRLRLDPFTLDLGQAVLGHDGTPLRLSGRVAAAPQGWVTGLEVAADRLDVAELMRLWPEAFRPGSRDWFARNLTKGTLSHLTYVLRTRPGAPPHSGLSLNFSGASIRALPEQPPIEGAAGAVSEIDGRLVVTLNAGTVTAPQGGRLDMAGSVMTIPRTGRDPPARFDLDIAGTITAAMAVLAGPPFNALDDSDLPVTLADGRAEIGVTIETVLKNDVPPEDRSWQASARLRDLRSEVLIPGRRLVAPDLVAEATSDSLTLRGDVQVDGVPASAVYSRALGAGSEGTARITAEVPLGPRLLRAFDIDLPEGALAGAGRAQLELDLSRDGGPGLALRSDLAGVGLSLPALGWSKPAATPGRLVLEGHLGALPRIDRIVLEGAGLVAEGAITLDADGGLDRALFSRVRIEDWFDAPVELLGRGAGQAPEVRVTGGRLDLRRARPGGDGARDGPAGGPVSMALDRLQVTAGIALTGFRGSFDTQGGLSGNFTGAVNGGAPVQGTVVPVEGGTGLRLRSADAGGVFRDAGLLENGREGALDMTVRPTGTEGYYAGRLSARDLRVRDAPALASLLDAISVVGLLTQLDGQGLLFSEVEAAFTLTPERILLQRASAVGPGLGLSLDGTYALAARQMDFQGVISPLYMINGLGAFLTRPGEGLIGFNFTLQGPVDSPRVLVNPLSALTPGMFREIFRRPPPRPSQ